MKFLRKIVLMVVITLTLIMVCGISTMAGDNIIRVVNIGMTGDDGSSGGAVYDSKPTVYSANGASNAQTVASTYMISESSFSKAYGNWKAGESIRVHVSLTPKNNYRFDSTNTVIKVFGKNVQLEEKSVASQKIKLILKYWPSMKLPQVDATTIRFDDENEFKLVWDPVQVDGSDWKYYEVMVKCDDAGSKSTGTKKVTTHSADLSELIVGTNYSIAIKTVAGNIGKARYVENSDWVIVNDNQQDVKASVEGNFSGSGDKLVYLDKSGNMVSGWVSINGCWYYFDPANKNRAVVNNFKQIDGKWYYFGDNAVMKLGWFKVGDYWYYFSPVQDATLGAMQTGWISDGPSGPFYFTNDGSVQGLPLGAMLTNTTTPDGHTVDAYGKRVN